MKSLQKKKSIGITDREFSRARQFHFGFAIDDFLTILRALHTDVYRLRPGTKGLDRDYVTLRARIEHEGPSFLGTALCSLGKALDKALAEGVFTCPMGFKRARGSKLPLLYGGIFCDVFDSSTGILKENSQPEDVKILRQLLFFLEKACYDAREREDSPAEYRNELLFERFLYFRLTIGSRRESQTCFISMSPAT